MRALVVAALAVVVAGCAPQLIISNDEQAVIDSPSPTDAVQLAVKECGTYGRWPLLQHKEADQYWFACKKRPETVARRMAEPIQSAPHAVVAPVSAPPVASAPPTADSMKKPEPVAPTSVAPAADTATKSKPVAAVAPAKGAWVQVGAFRSRTVAERYIREIRAAHGGVIKGHEFLLSEQTLGKRGLFHLARLGPFRRMTDARRTCDTLKSRGAPCFVVRVR